MAESELTKEIKRALRGYAPLMKTKKRTVRWAEEVAIGTGFVDFIRFEDCIVNTRGGYSCKIPICKIPDLVFPNINCHNCVHRHNGMVHELGIAVTCFEIKISKKDFQSNNGHNFAGNYNYYVVPKVLYPKINDLVPDDIGIILYYGHGCLMRKKHCEYKEVAKEDLNLMLYNALKKWVDMYCWRFAVPDPGSLGTRKG